MGKAAAAAERRCVRECVWCVATGMGLFRRRRQPEGGSRERKERKKALRWRITNCAILDPFFILLQLQLPFCGLAKEEERPDRSRPEFVIKERRKSRVICISRHWAKKTKLLLASQSASQRTVNTYWKRVGGIKTKLLMWMVLSRSFTQAAGRWRNGTLPKLSSIFGSNKWMMRFVLIHAGSGCTRASGVEEMREALLCSRTLGIFCKCRLWLFPHPEVDLFRTSTLYISRVKIK